jgi:hypothetical protein
LADEQQARITRNPSRSSETEGVVPGGHGAAGGLHRGSAGGVVFCSGFKATKASESRRNKSPCP